MRRFAPLLCLVAGLASMPLARAQLGQSDCSLARSEIERDACYRSNRDNAQRNSTSRQRIEDSSRQGSGAGTGYVPTPQEAERLEYWRKRTAEENAKRDEEERRYRASDEYKALLALQNEEIRQRVWQRQQLFAAYPAPFRFRDPIPATIHSGNNYFGFAKNKTVQQMLRDLFPDSAKEIIQRSDSDFRGKKKYADCWGRDGTPGEILALLPVDRDSRRAALFRHDCKGEPLYRFESLSTDTESSEGLRITREDYVAALTAGGVPVARHFPPEPARNPLQRAERRCFDDDDAASCAIAAKAYATGDGVKQNPDMAGQFLLLSCHSPQRLECGTLSAFHYLSTGIERSTKKALETAREPCTRDSQPTACAVLGSLYLHGFDVDRDYSLALRHLTTGCNGGNGLGCLGLGQMYEEGLGLARDPVKARKSYEDGCKAGFDEACRRLKGMQGS